MDDLDLYELLSQDRQREKAAREFFVSIKTAGIKAVYDTAKDLGKKYYQAKKPELAGAAAGGLLAGAYGYALAKRWKKGEPSALEQDSASMLASRSAAKQGLKAKKKKPGFLHKMQDVGSKAYSGVAKAMAEHPARASLLFAMPGMTAGSRFGRMVKESL